MILIDSSAVVRQIDMMLTIAIGKIVLAVDGISVKVYFFSPEITFAKRGIFVKTVPVLSLLTELQF